MMKSGSVKVHSRTPHGKVMRFEQLNEGVWAMTYLVVDEVSNQAALIDPVYDLSLIHI